MKIQLLIRLMLCTLFSGSCATVASASAHYLSGNDSLLTTLTIDNNDTIRFEFNQAVCTPTYIQIPVSMISDDQVYALDFALKFDPTEISYFSYTSLKPYLNVAANYNAADSTVRFSSFSFSQPIESGTPLLSVRFNYGSLNQVNFAVFDSVETQLNGDYCSKQGVSAGLNPPIGPGGTPTVVPGDSILLSIPLLSGQSSLWSNGSTGPFTYVHNPGTYSVTVTNTLGCSGSSFITLSAPNPLPIELIYFSGNSTESGITLTWITASEFMSDRFVIEKLDHENNFETIAVVPSNGNSSTNSNYMYTDTEAQPGSNVYRLIEIDKDGHAVFFDPIVVKYESKESSASSLSIYPNPGAADGGSVRFVTSGMITGKLQLKLHDLAGRLMADVLLNEEMFPAWPLPNLPKGVYVVTLTDQASYNGCSLLMIE